MINEFIANFIALKEGHFFGYYVSWLRDCIYFALATV